MSRLLHSLVTRYRRGKPDEFDDTEVVELQRRNRRIVEDLKAGRVSLDEVREHARQQASQS